MYTDIAVRSIICHTATGTHMPSQDHMSALPPGRADIPTFTPAEAGTRFSNPGGMQGLVDQRLSEVTTLRRYTNLFIIIISWLVAYRDGIPA